MVTQVILLNRTICFVKNFDAVSRCKDETEKKSVFRLKHPSLSLTSCKQQQYDFNEIKIRGNLILPPISPLIALESKFQVVPCLSH